jgi:hypothetical protein
LERPKPVYKPKVITTYKPTITKPTTKTNVKTSSNYVVNNTVPAATYKRSNILSTRVFKKNISNRFYAGHCTWYMAATTPQMFPYTTETTQVRPFG